MLAGEIEPFAQAHIKNLQKVREELETIYSTSPIDSDFTLEKLDELGKMLNNTERALYRFQVCMIDEHKMKERLHEKNLHCRFNHTDQD